MQARLKQPGQEERKFQPRGSKVQTRKVQPRVQEYHQLPRLPEQRNPLARLDQIREVQMLNPIMGQIIKMIK